MCIGKPNWSKWNLIPNAMVWQVVALSLDISPDDLDGMNSYLMKREMSSSVNQEFNDRLYIVAVNADNDANNLLCFVTLHQSGKEDWEINIPKFAKWAIEKNLVIPHELKQRAESEQVSNSDKPLFDVKDATYPIELDMAIKAWQAVSQSSGKGKPRVRIRAWLDSNTTLSNEAKERISTVANWDKLGGAPRTE